VAVYDTIGSTLEGIEYAGLDTTGAAAAATDKGKGGALA
jgi:hypothetical protein